MVHAALLGCMFVLGAHARVACTLQQFLTSFSEGCHCQAGAVGGHCSRCLGRCMSRVPQPGRRVTYKGVSTAASVAWAPQLGL
jgi:hypothetical protein